MMTATAGVRQRQVFLAHAIWAVLLLVPFAAFLAYLSRTELPPGQCTGVGWGCGVAGMAAVGIALLFYGIPLALVWVMGHAVIGVVQWIRRRSTDRD